MSFSFFLTFIPSSSLAVGFLNLNSLFIQPFLNESYTYTQFESDDFIRLVETEVFPVLHFLFCMDNHF